MIPHDLMAVVELARTAGRRILDVYAGEFKVRYKADESPLTEADLASQRVIVEGLTRLFPDIPILSEEGELPPYEERRRWPRFFLVDPLDGTKEFVKRNGEFTVNIGLVEGRTPRFGVVFVPVRDAAYFGGPEWGSFKRVGNGPAQGLHAQAPQPGEGWTVLVSRSHPSPGLEAYLQSMPVKKVVEAGSAYKFCLVAEGGGDLYPRLSPGTWEWDTAAGQAVVEGAGGRMTDLDGQPFLYNKEDLRNGPYLAIA